MDVYYCGLKNILWACNPEEAQQLGVRISLYIPRRMKNVFRNNEKRQMTAKNINNCYSMRKLNDTKVTFHIIITVLYILTLKPRL